MAVALSKWLGSKTVLKNSNGVLFWKFSHFCQCERANLSYLLLFSFHIGWIESHLGGLIKFFNWSQTQTYYSSDHNQRINHFKGNIRQCTDYMAHCLIHSYVGAPLASSFIPIFSICIAFWTHRNSDRASDRLTELHADV